ncbi:hypothetical protein HK103_006090 [Boothiomyces macroporosus]|uniref:RRM domain-containing protein n=1 Tax=Boothiomyces macroporosus TaxID=261099 RepID=A0AAD5UE76_9FUNG|nr:hypothetical protein HK103_006090 [Boothiomyces macroporosus]
MLASPAEPMTTNETKQELFTVFVGNLSYSTDADALKSLFAPVAPVQDVRLITRFNKPKGFGFVSFSTQAEAESAVQSFDQKEIEGRVLKVQIAVAKKVREPSQKAPKKAKRVDDEKEETNEEKETPAPEKPKKNKRKPKSAKKKEEKEEGKEEAQEKQKPKKKEKAEGKEKPEAENKEKPEGEKTEKVAQAERTKKPKRAPRKPRSPDAPRSDTIAYVGNLPFVVDDRSLGEIFSDFKIKSSRVVFNSTGRSKGFGFVEFYDKESLLKAIEEYNGAKANERIMAVKQAYADEQE